MGRNSWTRRLRLFSSIRSHWPIDMEHWQLHTHTPASPIEPVTQIPLSSFLQNSTTTRFISGLLKYILRGLSIIEVYLNKPYFYSRRLHKFWAISTSGLCSTPQQYRIFSRWCIAFVKCPNMRHLNHFFSDICSLRWQTTHPNRIFPIIISSYFHWQLCWFDYYQRFYSSSHSSPSFANLNCSLNAVDISSLDVILLRSLHYMQISCFWARTVTFFLRECFTWVGKPSILPALDFSTEICDRPSEYYESC